MVAMDDAYASMKTLCYSKTPCLAFSEPTSLVIVRSVMDARGTSYHANPEGPVVVPTSKKWYKLHDIRCALLGPGSHPVAGS